MAVGPDIAIPIGLIVTEAISSALNRSLDSTIAPEIRIEAADKAGTVELTIEDNGAGGAGSIGYLAETAVQGDTAEDRQRIVELALASGLPVVVQATEFS